jgi:hypothetical protein
MDLEHCPHWLHLEPLTHLVYHTVAILVLQELLQLDEKVVRCTVPRAYIARVYSDAPKKSCDAPFHVPGCTKSWTYVLNEGIE